MTLSRPGPLDSGVADPRRLFTPSYWMAFAAIHFYFISYHMSVVEVPKSLAGEPDWLVGLVVGALGIAGMVTRPLVGVWVDEGNRQRWLRIGAVATVVAFGGYAMQLDPWLTIPFRALHGIAMGLFTTALLAIVTSMLPAGRRGFGVGLYQTSNTIAGLYAAALAIALIGRFSFEFAFIFSGVAAAGGLLFGALAGDPGEEEAADRRAREREARRAAGPGAPRIRRRWVSTTALLPAAVFLSVTTPFGAINAFLPLFADERALGNVGLFYTALAAAQLVTRSGAGWLSDRFGRGAVVMPALLLASLGLMMLAGAQVQAALLLAAVLYGVGIAAVQTTIVALIVDRTDVSALGSAMATYTMAWDVGSVLGAVLLGALAGATSYATVFALCVAFPLAGLALFVLRVRHAPAALPETTRVAATGK